jgi:hypothetical protein
MPLTHVLLPDRRCAGWCAVANQPFPVPDSLYPFEALIPGSRASERNELAASELLLVAARLILANEGDGVFGVAAWGDPEGRQGATLRALGADRMAEGTPHAVRPAVAKNAVAGQVRDYVGVDPELVVGGEEVGKLLGVAGDESRLDEVLQKHVRRRGQEFGDGEPHSLIETGARY